MKYTEVVLHIHLSVKMQGRMFDHIQDLEKSRTNWRIKARLTRFWPTFSPETSTIKGYNLILLDDDVSKYYYFMSYFMVFLLRPDSDY